MDEFDAAVAAFYRATHHEPAAEVDPPAGEDPRHDEIARLMQRLSARVMETFAGEVPG